LAKTTLFPVGRRQIPVDANRGQLLAGVNRAGLNHHGGNFPDSRSSANTGHGGSNFNSGSAVDSRISAYSNWEKKNAKRPRVVDWNQKNLRSERVVDRRVGGDSKADQATKSSKSNEITPGMLLGLTAVKRCWYMSQ
jgi:hypothetical protein